MEIEPSHDETSDGRSFCPSDFPTHEIDRSRIQFNDDGKDCPKGGFALVRKAWLLPPVSTPSSGSRELVAVKILRVDDRISPERLWKVCTPLFSRGIALNTTVYSDLLERSLPYRPSTTPMSSDSSVPILTLIQRRLGSFLLGPRMAMFIRFWRRRNKRNLRSRI